jgi:hypothetical protein
VFHVIQLGPYCAQKHKSFVCQILKLQSQQWHRGTVCRTHSPIFRTLYHQNIVLTYESKIMWAAQKESIHSIPLPFASPVLPFNMVALAFMWQEYHIPHCTFTSVELCGCVHRYALLKCAHILLGYSVYYVNIRLIWPNIKCYFLGIQLEGLGTFMKNLMHGTWSIGQDMKSRPPKYKAWELPSLMEFGKHYRDISF